ncbi:MAG: bb3-type cytochrome oxidase subunit III [Betaproteobacteria bacterium HGW-Betaproteobacteria-9]|jgi:cytochrome c oxidase subunit 3|nr:MAG: bb3-type cytochrome oxidase subunit III [Betaproteobacteria bacterium HGW-Betaproteobacteria-9]
MNTTTLQIGDPAATRARAAATGLWLFMGVVSTLFALFLVAYAMRMDAADWSPIAMPPQLWLSSALLLAGGLLLQRSARAAHAFQHTRARRLLLAGGVAAMAFLGSQLWAWQSLLDARVALAGNPAASFFYVLTALHGLHVIGGLVAWSATVQSAVAPPAEPRRLALHITLCARYWHFLFAVWVVLFAALGWLTPDVVRFICGDA